VLKARIDVILGKSLLILDFIEYEGRFSIEI
jgi:hypothetical protein